MKKSLTITILLLSSLLFSQVKVVRLVNKDRTAYIVNNARNARIITSKTYINQYLGDSILTGNNANMISPNDWTGVGLTPDFATTPGFMTLNFTSGNQWTTIASLYSGQKDSKYFLKIKRLSGNEQSLHVGRRFASTVDGENDIEITPDTIYGVYIFTCRGEATDNIYIGTPSAENQGASFLIDYLAIYELDTIAEENETSIYAGIPKVKNSGWFLDTIQNNADNLAIVGIIGNSIMANNYGGENTCSFGECPPRMTIRNVPTRIYDTLYDLTTGFNEPLYRRIDHGDWSKTGTWNDTTGKDMLRPEYGVAGQTFRSNYSYSSTPGATAEIIIPDGYENCAIIYHKAKNWFGADYEDTVTVELNSGSIAAYGDTIIDTYRNTAIMYRDGLYQLTEYSGLPSGANTITLTKGNDTDNLVMWGIAYWTGKAIMVLNYAAGGRDMYALWNQGNWENGRLLEDLPWRMFDYVIVEMTGMNEAGEANTLNFQQTYTETILNIFRTRPTLIYSTHPFGCSDGSCTTNYYTLYDSPVDLKRRYQRFYYNNYWDIDENNNGEVYNIFQDFEAYYNNLGYTLESGEGAKLHTSDGQHLNSDGTELFIQYLLDNIFK